MNISRRILLKLTLTGVVASPNLGLAVPTRSEMKPSTSATSFDEFLAQRHLAIATLTIPQLVENTLAFYRSVRALGLAPNHDADMLLFQWGVFNWGKGEFFEFDITRQFISAGKTGDDAISQLRCTAYFIPTPSLRAIPVSNRWCTSISEAESFSNFIISSAAYRAVQGSKPSKVAASWEKV